MEGRINEETPNEKEDLISFILLRCLLLACMQKQIKDEMMERESEVLKEGDCDQILAGILINVNVGRGRNVSEKLLIFDLYEYIYDILKKDMHKWREFKKVSDNFFTKYKKDMDGDESDDSEIIDYFKEGISDEQIIKIMNDKYINGRTFDPTSKYYLGDDYSSASTENSEQNYSFSKIPTKNNEQNYTFYKIPTKNNEQNYKIKARDNKYMEYRRVNENYDKPLSDISLRNISYITNVDNNYNETNRFDNDYNITYLNNDNAQDKNTSFSYLLNESEGNFTINNNNYSESSSDKIFYINDDKERNDINKNSESEGNFTINNNNYSESNSNEDAPLISNKNKNYNKGNFNKNKKNNSSKKFYIKK